MRQIRHGCNTKKTIILLWSNESLKQNLVGCVKVRQLCPFPKKPSLLGYLSLYGLIFSVLGDKILIAPYEFVLILCFFLEFNNLHKNEHTTGALIPPYLCFTVDFDIMKQPSMCAGQCAEEGKACHINRDAYSIT